MERYNIYRIFRSRMKLNSQHDRVRHRRSDEAKTKGRLHLWNRYTKEVASCVFPLKNVDKSVISSLLIYTVLPWIPCTDAYRKNLRKRNLRLSNFAARSAGCTHHFRRETEPAQILRFYFFFINYTSYCLALFAIDLSATFQISVSGFTAREDV